MAPAADAKTIVDAFADALNRKDLLAMGELLSDDTVFENTTPAPDGTRYVGKQDVMNFWRRWVGANPDAVFEAEEIVVAGDQVTVRWISRKTRDGQPWHLRGMDLFTVKAGKVAAKLSYVKG